MNLLPKKKYGQKSKHEIKLFSKRERKKIHLKNLPPKKSQAQKLFFNINQQKF